MSTPASLMGTAVCCSFCGKPDAEVQKIVAGPGVYICNECVELAAWVIDDASRASSVENARRRADAQNRTVEEILASLPPLIRSVDRVERELVRSIAFLRGRGIAWKAISAAADRGVDELRRRFQRPTSE